MRLVPSDNEVTSVSTDQLYLALETEHIQSSEPPVASATICSPNSGVLRLLDKHQIGNRRWQRDLCEGAAKA